MGRHSPQHNPKIPTPRDLGRPARPGPRPGAGTFYTFWLPAASWRPFAVTGVGLQPPVMVATCNQPWYIVPTADLVEDALRMAVTTGVTAYDAVYAVLAQRMSVPLVTADEALARRLAGSGADVRFLGDWP